MKEINYYVIGGQYESYCYGGTKTLSAAKRMASQNKEHWDNWQGWHVPMIYRAEDTIECENFYGTSRCAKRDEWGEKMNPVAYAVGEDNNGKTIWRDAE